MKRNETECNGIKGIDFVFSFIERMKKSNANILTCTLVETSTAEQHLTLPVIGLFLHLFFLFFHCIQSFSVQEVMLKDMVQNILSHLHKENKLWYPIEISSKCWYIKIVKQEE